MEMKVAKHRGGELAIPAAEEGKVAAVHSVIAGYSGKVSAKCDR
jgi:hypothetical protein